MTALKSDPVSSARLKAFQVVNQLREAGLSAGIREATEQEDISFEMLEHGGLSAIALAWFNKEARGKLIYIYPVAPVFVPGLPCVGYRIV